MAVLPENMDKLNVSDTEGSLSKIEDYIRYMGERIEFSIRNMTKTVSAAGVSSAELYILFQAQGQTLAAIQSALNSLDGEVNALQSTVTGIQSSIGTIQAAITSLDERVTALENPTPEPAE